MGCHNEQKDYLVDASTRINTSNYEGSFSEDGLNFLLSTNNVVSANSFCHEAIPRIRGNQKFKLCLAIFDVMQLHVD
jgi:hypothetical protein